MNFVRLATLIPTVSLLAYSGCSDSTPSASTTVEVTTGSEADQLAGGSSALTHRGRRCAALQSREDILRLPAALKRRLCEVVARPRTYDPMVAFSEADIPSQLFQYYLIDTTPFQPNVFTAEIQGINDGTKPTATGPNGNKATIGAVRVVLEPKRGKPRDPNDVRAVIDIFTDVSGLFVINNESGWYEGWMIHDVKVAAVDSNCHTSGMAPGFGMISAADAQALAT